MKNKDEEIELDDNIEGDDWKFEPGLPYTSIDIFVTSPSRSCIIKCLHEPIDVGFNKIKLVCKICDKDL